MARDFPLSVCAFCMSSSIASDEASTGKVVPLGCVLSRFSTGKNAVERPRQAFI